MNSLPRVSVLVSLYNGGRYIGQTLGSVFDQTFEDFELIVVDDGSTDGSAEYVEREFPDSRMRLIRQTNGGHGNAICTALRHSRGEWVAFLDHDDLWMPPKLERQLHVAASAPSVALVFSDCLLIDAEGHPLARASDRIDVTTMDLDSTRGYDALLRRGCFITMSTVIARTAAVHDVGGINADYRYALDYDLWLRLARRYPIRFVPEILASWRVHESQFTYRQPQIALAEESHLLRPIYLSSSFPRPIRVDVGDYIFGRHRDCCAQLLRQRRPLLAFRAAVGIVRYPGRVTDYCRHRANRTSLRLLVEGSIDRWLHAYDACARGRAAVQRMLLRARRAPHKLRRVLFGAPEHRACPTLPVREDDRIHVWIDGSPLASVQSGYFNLVSELIRTLVRDCRDRCIVHVTTPRAGRSALLRRLGSDTSSIRFHSAGRASCHWSAVHRVMAAPSAQVLVGLVGSGLVTFGMTRANLLALAGGLAMAGALAAVLMDEAASIISESGGRPRERWLARLVRFLWRRWPGPHGRPPHPNTIEVVVWRGLFRWSRSTRVAIVQDMTTRIHPELHTAENVAEFDEFLRYVQRHAEVIGTISTQSRTDVIERIAVYPGAVTVIPMPVHPQYIEPQFDAGVLSGHGIDGPFVLCVGTIEPRKNLRRLVQAFELLTSEDSLRGHVLVLAGPQGWDEGFRRFVLEHDACRRVKVLGFVPGGDLPSLYHFASAVICPSLYEGFGLPVLEAMCCSGVVLASRISALPEVVGDDGIQFDPHSTEDIARALLHALTMPAPAAAEYRHRCRRRAEALLEQSALLAPLPGLRREGTPVTA